jgi:hypothetical protein
MHQIPLRLISAHYSLSPLRSAWPPPSESPTYSTLCLEAAQKLQVLTLTNPSDLHAVNEFLDTLLDLTEPAHRRNLG